MNNSDDGDVDGGVNDDDKSIKYSVTLFFNNCVSFDDGFISLIFFDIICLINPNLSRSFSVNSMKHSNFDNSFIKYSPPNVCIISSIHLIYKINK